MISLEEYVHRENLALFKMRLADPQTTEAQRDLLLRLLAKEEAKDILDADVCRLAPSEVRAFSFGQDP
jgi:hypothetical protein